MDHLERAKRQEEAPLIEEAFQKSLEEEKILHEQEQLREIELSKQHHACDLQEKIRLSRLLEHRQESNNFPSAVALFGSPYNSRALIASISTYYFCSYNKVKPAHTFYLLYGLTILFKMWVDLRKKRMDNPTRVW